MWANPYTPARELRSLSTDNPADQAPTVALNLTAGRSTEGGSASPGAVGGTERASRATKPQLCFQMSSLCSAGPDKQSPSVWALQPCSTWACKLLLQLAHFRDFRGASPGTLTLGGKNQPDEGLIPAASPCSSNLPIFNV